MNLGEGNSARWTKHSRMLGLAIKPVLEALTMAIQLLLLAHPLTPPHYESGVVYQEEPPGTDEEFASLPVILARGWGDCDDLAPARCAELRNQGHRAHIRIQWKRFVRPDGMPGKLYHIVVRRSDGSIEDPSRILGMRS